MSNQVIGITGVFGLTFFLLTLRHLLLIWSQPSRRRHLSPSVPSNFVSNTAKDDSWLLRPQDDTRESGGLAAPEKEVRTPPDFGRAARR
jgi:hypothetical protein